MRYPEIKTVEKEIPDIRTKRLLLRNIDTADLENIYRGLSHPDVIQYYGVSFDSLESTKVQMTWFAHEKQYWWAICSLDGQEFYGAGGLNDVSFSHKTAEIGLWLLPGYWGQGIMKEVMPLICDFGFKQLGLRRIEGFIASGNRNCKAAMAKLNFKHEGTMINSEIKNGQFINVDIYAILNEAYNAL